MSTKIQIECPECQAKIIQYHNPVPTADIIIEIKDKIVLIDRKNEPHGWAIPGGFIDYGETTEKAALREAKEETGLDCQIIALLGVYSDPARDPRSHTISTVYVAQASDNSVPKGADDALTARLFHPDEFPDQLAFDHAAILKDYIEWKTL